jgi:hypothetical protein
MFSDAYRGVKYFGHWAEETADAFGGRDALAVLRDAADRCAEEDMRTPHVAAALAFLAATATRQGAFDAFRRGLGIPDPATRSVAVLAALASIVRVVGASNASK